mgnify:CR=1 FL=1
MITPVLLSILYNNHNYQTYEINLFAFYHFLRSILQKF